MRCLVMKRCNRTREKFLTEGNTEGSNDKKCLVSIIIPVFNQLAYTKDCIGSLLETLTLYRHDSEVILVDNGSTDGTGDYLKTLPDYFKVITNQQNLGFARACNLGAAAARGDFLVFLNNDTVALPGWLGQMLNVMEKEEQVGIVGSKLLFPDGTIQHAGVVVAAAPYPISPYHAYYQQPGDLPAANKMRDYQAVTGACLLIKRDLFVAVGAFDEDFINGYEDVDLCFKVRQQGYRVVYCPTSVLYHHQSVSEGRADYNYHNTVLLHQKWLGIIKPDVP